MTNGSRSARPELLVQLGHEAVPIDRRPSLARLCDAAGAFLACADSGDEHMNPAYGI